MVAEKAVYWMAVGVLGIGLCNSVSRNLSAAPSNSWRSVAVVQPIATQLANVKDYLFLERSDTNFQAHVAACPRGRAIRVVTVNLQPFAGGTRVAIAPRMAAAQCRREIALRNGTRLAVAVPRLPLNLAPSSM